MQVNTFPADQQEASSQAGSGHPTVPGDLGGREISQNPISNQRQKVPIPILNFRSTTNIVENNKTKKIPARPYLSPQSSGKHNYNDTFKRPSSADNIFTTTTHHMLACLPKQEKPSQKSIRYSDHRLTLLKPNKTDHRKHPTLETNPFPKKLESSYLDNYLFNLKRTKYEEWSSQYNKNTEKMIANNNYQNPFNLFASEFQQQIISKAPTTSSLGKLGAFLNKIEAFLENPTPPNIENLANDFIGSLEQEHATPHLFFESLYILVNNFTYEEAVAELLTVIVQKMKSYQLLLHKTILENIANCHDLECNPLKRNIYILIYSHLKPVYAKEFIRILIDSSFDKKTIKNLLNSHTWFVNTGYFLEILCQEATKAVKQDAHSPQGSNLLKVADMIIKQPHYYPIPANSIDEINSLLQQNADPKTQQQSTELMLQLSPTSPNYSHERSNVKTFLQTSGNYHFSEVVIKIKGDKNIKSTMISHIAEDLKKIETIIFCSILPEGFTNYVRKDETEKSATIRFYIQYTNALSYWAISQILSSEHIDVRVRWCEFYIKLTKTCKEMGNLNTAFTLYGALMSLPISRLKLTWQKVKEGKIYSEWEEMQSFFDIANNQKNYVEFTKKWKKDHPKPEEPTHCFLPIFSRYLKHLTAIEENSNYSLKDGKINYDKISLLAKQHSFIKNYQNHLLIFKDYFFNQIYHFDIHNHILALINDNHEKQDMFSLLNDQLIIRSLHLEPRKSLTIKTEGSDGILTNF